MRVRSQSSSAIWFTNTICVCERKVTNLVKNLIYI